MTDATLTPASVSRTLGRLSAELDQLVSLLQEADLDAVRKRHGADIAESSAFVRAEGAMDIRKHKARIEADKQEEEALVAEALVRHLRKKIDAIQTRIDVGRSLGAAMRAELQTVGHGGMA